MKDQNILDWIVLGGGLVGTALALYIKQNISTKINIIDPHTQPIERWTVWARNCGMTHMRSPASHSLSWDFDNLWEFILSQGLIPEQVFRPPNKRPTLEHFLAHSKDLIQKADLQSSWLQDRAVGLEPLSQGWSIQTDSGKVLTSKNVLLALGGRQTPAIPAPFDSLPPHLVKALIGAPLAKIAGPRVLVVGGGISGVQKALELAENGQQVYLLVQRAIEPSLYDHNVGFNGPKLREKLKSQRGKALLELVQKNKYAGTVTPDLIQRLGAVEKSGQIMILQEAKNVQCRQNTVRFDSALGTLTVDQVILATGFQEKQPSNPLISKLLEQGYPGEEGYPFLKADLSWRPGLYVAGAMAEVRLGPGAGNLIGHHLARRRIFPG